MKVESLAYGALEGVTGEVAPAMTPGIDESRVPYGIQVRSITSCATVQDSSAVACHVNKALVQHSDLDGKLIAVVNPAARLGIADEAEKLMRWESC